MAIASPFHNNGSAGSSLTAPGNWGTSADKDVIFLSLCLSGATTLSATMSATGWNLILDETRGTTSTDKIRTYVWWKRVTGVESAPAFSSITGYRFFVQTFCSGCVETGDPYEWAVDGGVDAATTSLSITTADTTYSDALILYHLSTERSQSTAWFGPPSNSSLTDIPSVDPYDACVTGGSGIGRAITYGTKSTAGSTGTLTSTISSSIYIYAAFAVLSTTSTTGAAGTNNGKRSLLGVGK